ncbi:MAG: DUF4381 family protein [Roseobacter sp.]
MSEDLSGLNLVELYDRLVLPAAPAPVSMWPQTAGWLWLLAALVVLMTFLAWRIYAWRRATAYRRAALAALAVAGDDPAAIADILRRAALAAYARDRVAGLYGRDWLQFLDKTAGTSFATSPAGEVLATAPFKAQPAHPDLHREAVLWIKAHHRNAGAG